MPIVDDHAASMQIASPHLYARVVQSFLALEAGEESLEPFLFLQDDDLLDAAKLLYVVTDPFHIDFANKKIMTALYGEINQLIRKNPLRQVRWEKQMVGAVRFHSGRDARNPAGNHRAGRNDGTGCLQSVRCTA